MSINDKSKTQSRRQFPVFESLAQCAAAIGASVDLLKAAKRKNCKAFITGSRVDSAILLPFLFEMIVKGSDLPSGFASWKEVLESERAKREAIKRQVDEKSVMPTEDAQRQAAFACAYLFGELERWERELPPSLAGLPATEVFKVLRNSIEALRKSAQDKFNEIGK